MSFSRFTRSSNGFALSVDAALAGILFLSIIFSIVLLSRQPQAFSSVPVNTLASDLFFTLNKTGFLLSELDQNAPSIALANIYAKSRGLLPRNFDLKIKLTEYDLSESACRAQKNFDSCFIESFSSETGGTIPQDSTIFHGKRVFLKRQPASDCNTSYAGLHGQTQDYFGPLFFQAGGDQNFAELVDFNVSVSPTGPVVCDQNVTVTLTVQTPSNVRRPVDIMLVMDRSGSMSWSGRGGSADMGAVWVDQNNAFASDGTSGVFSFDVSNPLIPTQLGSDDPGTVNDIHGKIGNIFVGDTSGTDEVYPYNSSNPSNLTRLSSIGFESSNGVLGLFVDGNYLYVAGDRTGGGNNRGLYIFNATNPSSITQTGKLDLTNSADVFVDGNTAYVARLGSGVSSVNVTNKSSPSLLNTVNPGGTSQGLYKIENYLYVASGDSGLSIIDVSNPSNMAVAGTHAAAGAGSGYSYNVFKQGNEAFIANNNSLYIVDVNNPSSPVFARSFATTYNYADVFVKENYAYLASDLGLVTVDIFDGPRLDNAKVSAMTFVDFNGWNFPPDQIGLASFSGSATLDRQLTSDANLAKADINALVASGGTNIASGITAATNELTSVRHNPNALRFQVLLSDGQSTSGDSQAAAQTAANNGIRIYTIAFGADADVAELATVAQTTDGNAYVAGDENALLEVFQLISLEIAETAQDANVIVPISSGGIIVNPGDGQIFGPSLVFDANDIEPGTPWTASYTVNFPCNAAANCGLDAVTFPGEGTVFTYIDSNGNANSIDFNASVTLDFLERDITVGVVGGEAVSSSEVYLDVNVTNIGDLNSGPAILNLRLNDLAGPILHSENVPALCGSSDLSCDYFSFEFYDNLNVGQSGLIYAVINDDNSVSECPQNNYQAVYCTEAPKTQYYLVDYWVWRKGS